MKEKNKLRPLEVTATETSWRRNTKKENKIIGKDVKRDKLTGKKLKIISLVKSEGRYERVKDKLSGNG